MSQYKEYAYNEAFYDTTHDYLLPSILSLLDKNKNRAILDVGCGKGALTAKLIDMGFNAYGTDASQTGIEIANRHYPNRFHVQDLSSDDLPDILRGVHFDTIISTEVVEHLYDPRGFVRFCKNVLVKNGQAGQIILTTPYHGYLKNLMLAATGKMDSHFTALWDGGHIKFWSRKTLSTLLEEQGFRVTNFKGSGRLPYFWKSMVLKGEIES
jgi:2-polyprenyl-3-methyl-5-hydroxy-6-metoxy-1,4-benzoquinol methylase